ncbi:MAG: GGDEF domain-containing protein [Bacilli bacterium]|nr:GGDEF domain-containing protein [Bacilli bacterium]
MKRKTRFPLWAKALLAFLFSVSMVSTVAVIFSSNVLIDITRSHYIEEATHLADTLGIFLDLNDVKTVQTAVKEKYDSIPEEQKVSNEGWDSPEWLAYLAKFNNIPSSSEYQRILKQIEVFHSKNEAKYTYIAYADLKDNRLVYLVDDSPIEERCLPGSFDEFSESDMTVKDHMDTGFTPEITNTAEYGYLVSVSRPIYDENEKDVIAFAMVELSMDEITAKESADIANLAFLLGGLAVASTMAGFLLVSLLIIRPIRSLTKVANEYTSGANENFDKFSKIDIHTRDEIEDLSNSMKKMEGDLNKYIADLLSAEMKADEMKHIADIDAMTGVGNKRAYFEKEVELNDKIKEGKADFALTMIDLNELKQINDTYGHEKGDETIVALSEVIKSIFPNSSIYRVGGDEFLVVSEQENCKDIDRLEKELNNALESAYSTPIFAAVGTAYFDKEHDNNFEDTFKRADATMYEDKRRMKSSS